MVIFPCASRRHRIRSRTTRGSLGGTGGFTVKIRDAKLAAGRGFVVGLFRGLLTIPGLPKKPNAESIDIDERRNLVELLGPHQRGCLNGRVVAGAIRGRGGAGVPRCGPVTA